MERDSAVNQPGASPPRPASRLAREELATIFAGGFLGAIVRSALAQTLAVRADQWPWATFLVNIAAALALGWLVTRLQQRLPPYALRHSMMATGFCGALSTFSTMMVELARMIDGAHWVLALGYAAASLAGGLAAVSLSSRLVRRSR